MSPNQLKRREILKHRATHADNLVMSDRVMIGVLAAVFAAAVGCTGSADRPGPALLVYCGDTAPVCQRSCEAAAAWWADLGVNLELVETPPASGVRMDYTPQPDGVRALGYALPNGTIYQYTCGELVAKHELGHALGLGHIADPGNLMYETYSDSTDLNPHQIEYVVRRYR